MSRAERLIVLIEALRRRRRPVSGKVLAEETGVSLRTLYRDIASLQAPPPEGLGVNVEGAPGVGYVLRPGFLMPPLVFPPEEIEALVLGSRWVAGRADPRLAAAARAAIARIGAVLPPGLREALEGSGLLVAPGSPLPPESVDSARLREAIRDERRLALSYRDAAGAATERVVWPFALAFFEGSRLLLAWCELRGDFRSFRTDRIVAANALEGRYPRRRRVLLREWQRSMGIDLAL